MRSLILFDGVCNLCNSFVDFVIRHQGSRKIYLASLQSQLGHKILSQLDKSQVDFTSVIFLKEGKAYSESTAVLTILGELRGFWPLLKIFLFVPAILRNGIYRSIAKHRYSWFGKKSTCRLPSPEEKEFLLETGEIEDYLAKPGK